MALLFLVIIPAILALLFLVISVVIFFKTKGWTKLASVIFAIVSLTTVLPAYFIITGLILSINALNNSSPQETIINIFKGANWGITRDEKIEEPAVKNDQLEIKLIKLYAFEGAKQGNPSRNCNLTLRYTNLTDKELKISTSSKVNFLYYAPKDDPYVDIEISPNEPQNHQNLMITQTNQFTDKLPENTIFPLQPKSNLEKTLDITCPDALLNGFTYYYDPKGTQEITSENMSPIQIVFDFTQGG